MPTRRFSFATLVSLILVSCSDRGNVVSTLIQDPTWQLESIESGDSTTSIPANEVYTLHFDNDSLVSGRVHCNTYFTNYCIVPPDSISFGPFNATKMGCPQPSNQLEFRRGFDNANAIDITSNRLRLYYLNRTRVLNFGKVR